MQDAQFKGGELPRIKIIKTTPKIQPEQLTSYTRCYMGISLDNPDFYGTSLEALLLWVTKNYQQCLVIIGDFLRRYNEQIFVCESGNSAEKASLAEGQTYLEQTRQIFSKYSEPSIKIVRWKECLDSVEYKQAKQILDRLYNSDQAFKASVQKDSFSFINRQKRKKQILAVSIEQAIEISSAYLIEEIAVFSSLADLGWNIEIYPGPELGVLVDIAKGNFSNIPEGLKKRINVELQIEKTQR